MGGAGAISAAAHLRTVDFVRMIDDGLAGCVVEARSHAEAPLPVVLALFAEPNAAVITGVGMPRAGCRRRTSVCR